MSESLDKRAIWLLQKKYQGGRVETIGAYWKETQADEIAIKNLPGEDDCYALAKQSVILFGSMIG